MVSYCEVFTTDLGCPGYEDSQDPIGPENQPTIDDYETKNPVQEINTIVQIDSNENATERVVRLQQLMMWVSRNEFVGHAVFTIVPFFLTVLSLLYMLRYSTATNYYQRFWVNSETDYFQYGDLIQGWGGLSLFSLSFITSLLAWQGIAVELNMVVWVWFMIIIGSVTTISGFVFKFLALDSAWTSLESPTLGLHANTVFTNIIIDIATQSSMLVSISLIFGFYWDHWEYAQWVALGVETQQEEIDELFAEIAAMERDMGYNPYDPPAE